MSNLQVNEPPVHGYKLFAVPGELLHGKLISDWKTINDKYKIIDCIQIIKGDILPSVLPLLAYGQYIDINDIWYKYKKSSILYFLICEEILKIDSNMNL